MFVLEVLLLPVMIFAEAAPLCFFVAILLAFGASLVALTLSRGQEMDESGA